MKVLARFVIGASFLGVVTWATARLVTLPAIPSNPLVEREPQSTRAPAFERRFETRSFAIHLVTRSNRLHLKAVDRGDASKVVWESPNDAAFASLSISRLRFDDRHQSYEIQFPNVRDCWNHSVTGTEERGGALVVHGRFDGRGCEYPFTLEIGESGAKNLDLNLSVKHDFEDPAKGIERDFLKLDKKILPPYPVLTLHAKSRFSEAIFGGGAQLSHFDLKGRKIPLVVREQGIGRGLAHPLLRGLDLVAPGASGDETSTSAPMPVFVTTDSRGFVLENYEPAQFDFQARDRVSISARAASVRAHVLPRSTLPEAVTAITEYTGRMKPLPEWFQTGATLGVQGGVARVREAIETARANGVPIAAVWIQDWVGRRQIDVAGLPVGSFLWWIWESDKKLYPDWPGFVAELASKKIRTLAYMNPYLVDATEKSGAQENLFADAERNGYLVRDATSGRAWIGDVIRFPAALVDLSNPRAREWLKSIVRERMVKIGIKGMMADFGEALPYVSKISVGHPVEYHNRFAEEWSRLPVTAAAEAGTDDFVSFTRAGYLRAPGSTRLFWLGDQLTTWDAHDGLKSSLIGLLSSGLSGQSLNHSDIGGYTAVAINESGIKRTKELFMRWTELNAFTAAFRTHEGSRPELNHQFDSDRETLQHFAKFAKIYASLAPYRKKLMHEAYEKGWPVVRPMAFYHANDVRVRALTSQFYLGSDVLVAPVLDSRADKVRVWMPEGEWIHLWSKKVTSITKAGWKTVAAPLGEPAVFYKRVSEFSRDHANVLN